MRVPSPQALSVGADIIATHRLLKLMPSASEKDKSRHMERLINRFLHPSEVQELTRRLPQWSYVDQATVHDQQKLGDWLAGRWAAKEAAKKAWGASMIGFKDLRTERSSDGQVEIICRPYREPSPSKAAYQSKSEVENEASSETETEMDIIEQSAKLSISHDGGFAMAVVLAAPLHEKIVADLLARKEAADRAVGKNKVKGELRLPPSSSEQGAANLANDLHSKPPSTQHWRIVKVPSIS